MVLIMPITLAFQYYSCSKNQTRLSGDKAISLGLTDSESVMVSKCKLIVIKSLLHAMGKYSPFKFIEGCRCIILQYSLTLHYPVIQVISTLSINDIVIIDFACPSCNFLNLYTTYVSFAYLSLFTFVQLHIIIIHVRPLPPPPSPPPIHTHSMHGDNTILLKPLGMAKIKLGLAPPFAQGSYTIHNGCMQLNYSIFKQYKLEDRGQHNIMLNSVPIMIITASILYALH